MSRAVKLLIVVSILSSCFAKIAIAQPIAYKQKLYLIPGIVAYPKLFKQIDFEGFDTVSIHPLPFLKNESLDHYAARLMQQIDTTMPFSLLGVSFGAMCATEISKIKAPQDLIIISGAVNENEIPASYKLMRYLPLYKLGGDAFFSELSWIFKKRFGVKSKEEKALFREMLSTVPKGSYKGAIYAIVHWHNKTGAKPAVRLHGRKDRIIPIKNLNTALVNVEQGTHLMIITDSDNISRELKTFAPYVLR